MQRAADRGKVGAVAVYREGVPLADEPGDAENGEEIFFCHEMDGPGKPSSQERRIEIRAVIGGDDDGAVGRHVFGTRHAGGEKRRRQRQQDRLGEFVGTHAGVAPRTFCSSRSTTSSIVSAEESMEIASVATTRGDALRVLSRSSRRSI